MQNLRILFAPGDVVGVTEIEAWGDYDNANVNCPTQSSNSGALHYEAESAVIYQGSAFGSQYACDWGVVGSLNAYGSDYFVKNPSAVTRGNWSGTTTGEQWQGMTGNAYIEWFVDIKRAGAQNMTVRYANGGNITAQMPIAVYWKMRFSRGYMWGFISDYSALYIPFCQSGILFSYDRTIV